MTYSWNSESPPQDPHQGAPQGHWAPSALLNYSHRDKMGTSPCGCSVVEAGGKIQGRLGCRRYHLGSWRAPSRSLVPVFLPSCQFANKVISEGAPGPRAREGPGLAGSQVASIRCRPAQDNRAINPKVYGAVRITKAQGCKKAKLEFPTPWAPHSFSLLFLSCFPLGLSLSFLVSASCPPPPPQPLPPPPQNLTGSPCSFCWASDQRIVPLPP